MNTLIKGINLTKRYSGFSLEGVNLEVPAGLVVGFIGENGAGKTTTIKALLGLIRPDAGSVEAFGQPVSQSSAQWKQIETNESKESIEEKLPAGSFFLDS